MRKGGYFFVIASLCCVLAFLFGFSIYAFNGLEYKESLAYIPHQEKVDPQLSNDESIKLINKLCGREFNLEFVENANYDGQVTFFAFFDNTIRINTNIIDDNTRFIWTYAHEVTHATKFCINERKTQYLTFVFLYESGIEYFKQVALFQASMMVNLVEQEYDATYYIVEYLKK